MSAAVTSCEVVGGNFFAAQKFSDFGSDGNASNADELSHDVASDHDIVIGPDTTSHGSAAGASSGATSGQASGQGSDAGAGSHSETSSSTGSSTGGSEHSQDLATANNPRVSAALEGLAGSLAEVGDQTKANLTLVLGQKLGLLKHRKTCYNILNKSLQAGSVLGSFNEQLKAAIRDTLEELATKSAPVNNQINDLTKQQIAAKQDVFRAIAQSVALQTNEAQTTATVDELKPKLTVGSYEKVKKATALRVYAVELIKKNYDNDKNRQLIMTMLLDAELAPNKEAKDQALRSAQSLVQKDILTNCKQFYEVTDYTQQAFNSVPDLVDPSCALDRVFDYYKAEFAKILDDATASADREMANGGGFLSTRDCVDKTVEEKQVSETTATHARELDIAQTARAFFEHSGDMANPAYIDAINKEKQAIADLNAVPEAVDGGIKPSCGPIVDAGGIIKTNYENYINQWMTQGLQGTKSDNAPLQAQFAKTIVDTLFGKITLNKKGSNSVFTEIGANFLNTVLTRGLSGLTGGSSSSSSSTGTQVHVGVDQISTTHSSTSSSTHSSPSSATPAPNPGGVRGDSTNIPVVPYFSPRSSANFSIRGEAN